MAVRRHQHRRRSPEQAAAVAAASDLPVSTITSGTPEVIVESNGRTLEVPVNGEPCANTLRRWGGTPTPLRAVSRCGTCTPTSAPRTAGASAARGDPVPGSPRVAGRGEDRRPLAALVLPADLTDPNGNVRRNSEGPTTSAHFSLSRTATVQLFRGAVLARLTPLGCLGRLRRILSAPHYSNQRRTGHPREIPRPAHPRPIARSAAGRSAQSPGCSEGRSER
jgi:hypothetical protein